MFPTVMEYQVQINSIKAKLQETRARKKQQEELIMKVENQALKVSVEQVNTLPRLHVQEHASPRQMSSCYIISLNSHNENYMIV